MAWIRSCSLNVDRRILETANFGHKMSMEIFKAFKRIEQHSASKTPRPSAEK